MMNSTKAILAATLLTLFAVGAESASTPAGIDARVLIDVVTSEVRKCPALNCPGSRVQLMAMTAADFAALPKDSRYSIREKMLELARDLWPDTILEGPYHVKFNVRLEREDMHLLIVDGQFVGYRIGYSDKAWDMDHCNPMTSPESKQDLNHCVSGRIFDRGFITSDFSVSFRDEGSMSHFEKDELVAR